MVILIIYSRQLYGNFSRVGMAARVAEVKSPYDYMKNASLWLRWWRIWFRKQWCKKVLAFYVLQSSFHSTTSTRSRSQSCGKILSHIFKLLLNVTSLYYCFVGLLASALRSEVSQVYYFRLIYIVNSVIYAKIFW